MKKNKDKKDKELYKELLLLVLSAVGIGTVVCTGLFFVCFAIMSIEISFPIQLLLGFLIGGGVSGIGIGVSIKNGLISVEYEEDIEYGEDDLEDEYENEFEQENIPTLKIVKGSGSNYGYKYNNEEKPRLEIVNPSDEEKKKRR